MRVSPQGSGFSRMTNVPPKYIYMYVHTSGYIYMYLRLNGQVHQLSDGTQNTHIYRTRHGIAQVRGMAWKACCWQCIQIHLKLCKARCLSIPVQVQPDTHPSRVSLSPLPSLLLTPPSTPLKRKTLDSSGKKRKRKRKRMKIPQLQRAKPFFPSAAARSEEVLIASR